MNYPIRTQKTDTITCFRANPLQVQKSYCTFYKPEWSFGATYYDLTFDPNEVMGDGMNPMRPRPRPQTFIATPRIPRPPNTRTAY
jgi:hypothetical protein